MNSLIKLAAITAAALTLVACGSTGGGGSSISAPNYNQPASGPKGLPYEQAIVVPPTPAQTMFGDRIDAALGTGTGTATFSTNAATNEYVNLLAPDAMVSSIAPASSINFELTIRNITNNAYGTPLTLGSMSIVTTEANVAQITAAPVSGVNPLRNVNAVLVLSGVTSAASSLDFARPATTGPLAYNANLSGSLVSGGTFGNAAGIFSNGRSEERKYITSVGSNDITDTAKREAYLVGSAALIMSKFNVTGGRAADAINIAATQRTQGMNATGYNFQVNNVLAPSKTLR